MLPGNGLARTATVDISAMRNLGPKSQQMLHVAGISTVEELRALGAVAAYARTRRVVAGASLNLLWALEGAIADLPWQEVARRHRTSLLLALEEHERRTADVETATPAPRTRPVR